MTRVKSLPWGSYHTAVCVCLESTVYREYLWQSEHSLTHICWRIIDWMKWLCRLRKHHKRMPSDGWYYVGSPTTSPPLIPHTEFVVWCPQLLLFSWLKSQHFNLLRAHKDFVIVALFSLTNNKRFYADAKIFTIFYWGEQPRRSLYREVLSSSKWAEISGWSCFLPAALTVFQHFHSTLACLISGND